MIIFDLLTVFAAYQLGGWPLATAAAVFIIWMNSDG